MTESVLDLAEEIRMLSGSGGTRALSLVKNSRIRPEDALRRVFPINFLIKGS